MFASKRERLRIVFQLAGSVPANAGGNVSFRADRSAPGLQGRYHRLTLVEVGGARGLSFTFDSSAYGAFQAP